ncbi:hypothetical protein [Azospirillum brasilense]|uniref:hypothetical protein n=1 Tax=Azospirillum brasilense TaxID=192 RepID=UPI0010C10F89|nr:hypothetical protein [Azospirillum brasilense]
MSAIIWKDDVFGVSVTEDSQGRFWIATSDRTPPAFREKPYICDGHFLSREDAISNAQILVEHCQLGSFGELRNRNA